MIPDLFPIFLSLLSKCAFVALCIICHEFGHVLAARFHYVPVKKIGFNWMGAYIQRGRTTGWPEVSICMAGAAVNLALAIVFWDVNYWFALCNLTFAWVNVLPIPHSDGSHALEALRAMNQRANA
ncbi:MAG: site-2 protease family protein [Acidobacteriaceae bacterium]